MYFNMATCTVLAPNTYRYLNVVNVNYASEIKIAENKAANNGITSMSELTSCLN